VGKVECINTVCSKNGYLLCLISVGVGTDIINVYVVFLIRCGTLQGVIMSVVLNRMCYMSICPSIYEPLRRCGHFDALRCCVVQ
jgi:hypothetical protein